MALNSTCQSSKELIIKAFCLAFPLLVDREVETLERALLKVQEASNISVTFSLILVMLGNPVQSLILPLRCQPIS